MKNKKGFTLIEIIICVSLITIIGVGSFVGIRLVDKKLLIDKLEQITDKAILAAQVYIETNKNASNQLYNNKNGVVLPLQLLVDEGLLSLEGTKLTEGDIDKKYVTIFLGSEGEGTNGDGCQNINTAVSWAGDKVLYLCMNVVNNTESSNKETILLNENSNKLKSILNEKIYYLKGRKVNNYVKYSNDLFNCTNSEKIRFLRIMSINNDDSLTVTFEFNWSSVNSLDMDYVKCEANIGGKTLSTEYVGEKDIFNSMEYELKSYSVSSGYDYRPYSWLGYYDNEGYNGVQQKYIVYSTNDYEDSTYWKPKHCTKMTLPSTCKLTTGLGTEDDPYNLEC